MDPNMRDQCPPALRERLAALRIASSAIVPPATLEEALRARLTPTRFVAATPGALPGTTRRAGAASWATRWANWIAWPISVTAAAGLVSWMVYSNPAVAPGAVANEHAVTSIEDGRVATPFLALAPFADIDPVMRGDVVRTTVPRATLAEFGLPVSPMRAAEPIDADFLVGADGGVLAVRFVDAAGL